MVKEHFVNLTPSDADVFFLLKAQHDPLLGENM